MLLLTSASIGVVPGPFYKFIHEGLYATVFILKLPYFNHYPNTEFIINIVWETFIILFAFGGLFLLEAVTALCNDTVSVSSKLSQLELNELSDEIEQNGGSKVKHSTQLKRIIMRVSHMDEYA